MRWKMKISTTQNRTKRRGKSCGRNQERKSETNSENEIPSQKIRIIIESKKKRIGKLPISYTRNLCHRDENYAKEETIRNTNSQTFREIEKGRDDNFILTPYIISGYLCYPLII